MRGRCTYVPVDNSTCYSNLVPNSASVPAEAVGVHDPIRAHMYIVRLALIQFKAYRLHPAQTGRLDRPCCYSMLPILFPVPQLTSTRRYSMVQYVLLAIAVLNGLGRRSFLAPATRRSGTMR
jgi:hypothetical protein